MKPGSTSSIKSTAFCVALLLVAAGLPGERIRLLDQIAPASPNGVQQAWAARYDGPASGNDDAAAIAVDTSGNVYVTGTSEGLGTGSDYATIKYSSAGQQQWVARYNGPGNGNDSANAIAIDGLGNVYVTGTSAGSGGFDQYATVKYDSLGVQQWVASYGTAESVAAAMILDSSGNTYVTGHSFDSGAGINDYATVKYNSAGQQEWVTRTSWPGTDEDDAAAITVDTSGNVYVTGTLTISGQVFDFDYGTVKYNSAGQQQWAVTYDLPAGSGFAHAIAVDGSGNVVVTGDTNTVKYNSAGQQQWASNGPGVAIGVDSSDNVLVTGRATIRYNSLGQEQWTVTYGPYEGMSGLSLDNLGNIYVTGESLDSGNYDYATIKYNSVGQEQWTAFYNGPNGNDSANAIAIDGLGNVYVTGTSAGFADDYATVKYVQTTPTPTPRPRPTPRSRPTPAPRP